MKLKKLFYALFALCIIAVAAVFAISHFIAQEDSLLMENIDAFAQIYEETDEEDGSSENGGGGGEGSEECWQFGDTFDGRDLRVCDNSSGKCWSKPNTAVPAGQGILKKCVKK